MAVNQLTSRAVIGMFYEELEAKTGAAWWDPISMYINSDQESETYAWLGQMPQMREWVAGRVAKGLREQSLTIRNKKFESTIDIPVDWMRRDKSGQVRLRIGELADRANTHWASLLTTLIENGESQVCYDGQYFFDTDHQEGDSGSQSNDITVDISNLPVNQHGSTTAPSPEEMEQAILQAVQQILGFVDDQGEPMNEGAQVFEVMVPQSFMSSALAAASNPVLTSGKTNTITSQNILQITPVVNSRLSWTEKFAVYRTDARTAPFIRQEEEGITTSSKAEGSEYEHDNDMHQYGVKAIRNVGYGMWQQACLVTLT